MRKTRGFPKSRASYFRFARFNTSALYYLRAWHRLVNSGSPLSFPVCSGRGDSTSFNKTIIPLALVGYEMILANSALRASLAISIISYPTRPREIIVKYTAIG